ncbi:hypothetical protein DYB30_002347 [Aphanomyces astaci]|uniref:Uncharacterized protein n=1 Tax=Aphanomyces astaci TaxID=112090 RepID=A0A397DA67_APHAT|nr:hypothetical protein DYB30_002347 [Aphanomyces astaci]
MLPSPLPDKAQAQAHRLLSSGDDDECRKFIRENNIDMDLPNAQGCTLLITACAFAQVKPNSNIPSVNDDDDEGPKDVTDDEADVLYDTFPLLRTMGISLAHFALHELDGLSMAQLDMLQDAHMHAFTVIGDKKVQVARQLEADRIHAAYELEQHIFNLG